MRPRSSRSFRGSRDKHIEFAWGGRIGIVINRAPAIGRLEPNLYYIEGYCGHGVNTSHVAAEIVADAICGTTERFDLFDRIRHMRLPVGPVGRQSAARARHALLPPARPALRPVRGAHFSGSNLIGSEMGPVLPLSGSHVGSPS